MILLIARMMMITALLLALAFPAESKEVKLRYMTSVYSDDQGDILRLPEGVGCRDGQLVIADTENNRLLRYTFNNRTMFFSGEIPTSEVLPFQVQLNSKGEIFTLDARERQVLTLGGDGMTKKYFEIQGLPGNSQTMIKSFTIGANDTMYLLDVMSGRVLVADQAGRFQKEIPLPADAGFISDLAVTRDSTILLVDSVAKRVYTLASTGQQFVPLGPSFAAYANFPTHLTVDAQGTIYVVDQYGSGIVLLDRNGAFQSRQAGQGVRESLLNYPAQICVDDDNNFFVADRNNNRLQIFAIMEK